MAAKTQPNATTPAPTPEILVTEIDELKAEIAALRGMLGEVAGVTLRLVEATENRGALRRDEQAALWQTLNRLVETLKR